MVNGHKDPDQIEEIVGRADDESKQARAGDAENAVGAAGDAENIIDESDADDFTDADGDDAQIIAAQMDDGACDDQWRTALR